MFHTCNSFWPRDIPHRIQFIIVLPILSVTAVVCNSLLIYSLIKTKQTQKTSFRFITIMSISDLFIGTIVMPSMAVTIALRDTYHDCWLDQITNYLFYFLCYFSYFMLMCIAFDRLHQVRRQKLFASAFTVKQANTIIAFCLALAAIGSYFLVAYISFTLQVVLVSINICLITSVIVAYILVLRRIKVHNITVRRNLANRNHKGSIPARMDATLTKTITVLLALLVVAYVQFNITTPWMTYIKYTELREPRASLRMATMWAYMFTLAYCFTNAIIIMYTNGRTRRFIRQWFNSYLGKRSSTVSPIINVAAVRTSKKSSTVFCRQSFVTTHLSQV